MKAGLLELERPLLVGMVHLLPTPGSPGYAGDFDAVLAAACRDARALAEGGLRAAMIENFGDAPFFGEQVPAETVASLAIALREVRRAAPELHLGINVLRNDARAALGLCATGGAGFLRVNVHVGAAVTDQGILSGRAAQTLRERQRLCPQALLLADVHVKHASPLGQESIAQAAEETAGRGRADGLIVSGSSTGDAPDVKQLAQVRGACPGTLLLVGSGLTCDSAGDYLRHADGAIVGTALKEEGLHSPVSQAKVAQLVEASRS